METATPPPGTFNFSLRNGDTAAPLVLQFFDTNDQPINITAHTFVLTASLYGRKILTLTPGNGTRVIAPNKLVLEFGLVGVNADGQVYRVTNTDRGSSLVDIQATALDYGIKQFTGADGQTIITGKITINKKLVQNDYS